MGLDHRKGLWVALYYWTYLAVLIIACASPLRIPPKAPTVPGILEHQSKFQMRR